MKQAAKLTLIEPRIYFVMSHTSDLICHLLPGKSSKAEQIVEKIAMYDILFLMVLYDNLELT